MSSILKTLRKLLTLFEQKNIDYMLIGGYALPHYGRIRATIDIDLAAAIKSTRELNDLYADLDRIKFDVPTGKSIKTPVILVRDREENIEVELWLKPDGVVFNKETLKRRIKVALGPDIIAWIISAEDFIVNKLSRPDRGAQDEEDVKSVLELQKGKLDMEYLIKRARATDVLDLLSMIMKR